MASLDTRTTNVRSSSGFVGRCTKQPKNAADSCAGRDLRHLARHCKHTRSHKSVTTVYVSGGHDVLRREVTRDFVQRSKVTLVRGPSGSHLLLVHSHWSDRSLFTTLSDAPGSRWRFLQLQPAPVECLDILSRYTRPGASCTRPRASCIIPAHFAIE